MKAEHDGKEIDVYYLCGKCAVKIGWRWPKGHCATCHIGECDVCGKNRGLTCWNDWLRPGQDKIRMEDWD